METTTAAVNALCLVNGQLVLLFFFCRSVYSRLRRRAFPVALYHLFPYSNRLFRRLTLSNGENTVQRNRFPKPWTAGRLRKCASHYRRRAIDPQKKITILSTRRRLWVSCKYFSDGFQMPKRILFWRALFVSRPNSNLLSFNVWSLVFRCTQRLCKSVMIATTTRCKLVNRRSPT